MQPSLFDCFLQTGGQKFRVKLRTQTRKTGITYKIDLELLMCYF